TDRLRRHSGRLGGGEIDADRRAPGGIRRKPFALEGKREFLCEDLAHLDAVARSGSLIPPGGFGRSRKHGDGSRASTRVGMVTDGAPIRDPKANWDASSPQRLRDVDGQFACSKAARLHVGCAALCPSTPAAPST